jgi:hypothetical protein
MPLTVPPERLTAKRRAPSEGVLAAYSHSARVATQHIAAHHVRQQLKMLQRSVTSALQHAAPRHKQLEAEARHKHLYSEYRPL